MSNVIFSPSLNIITDKSVASLSKTMRLSSDWESVTDQFWINIYYGKEKLPEGKRRKEGVLELEDIPPKSNDELFAEEMDELNDKHYQDVLDATNSYNIAKARDGSTETEKVIAARAKISEIDAQYEVDQMAIINKYYGA